MNSCPGRESNTERRAPIHALVAQQPSVASGKIQITRSIAARSFNAVYNGTKAFLNSFAFAIREELKGTPSTVTCLVPGATETEFFRRADLLDTKIGTREGLMPPMSPGLASTS